MARPCELTLAAQKAICLALQRGATRKDAAAAAGLCYDTLRDWYARGSSGRSRRDKRDEFVAFAASLDAAEADCARFYAGQIQDGAITDWRAAAWWLERRRRKQFGKADRDDGPAAGATVTIQYIEVIRHDERSSPGRNGNGHAALPAPGRAEE